MTQAPLLSMSMRLVAAALCCLPSLGFAQDAERGAVRTPASAACQQFTATGLGMAARKSRGWTKQQQLAHFRKQFGDADAMVAVNTMLTFVYSGVLDRLGREAQRAFFLNTCARMAALEPGAPR